ncbi:MAG: methyltransferase [Candidatus Eisenbacteria bacterium]
MVKSASGGGARKKAGGSSSQGPKKKREGGRPARVHGRVVRGAGRPGRTGRREDAEPAVAETRLRIAEREFVLERYPASSDATLRAWSAAEEHLLGRILELGDDGGPLLILGDPHGALTTVLAVVSSRPLVRWTDSHLATIALEKNLESNGVDRGRVELVPSSTDPTSLSTKFGTVLMVIPKTLSLLEYQLEWMKPCLTEGARVLAGGMTRHLSPKVEAILEGRLGPSQISKVWKKSVVFEVKAEDLEQDEDALTPSYYEIDLMGGDADTFVVDVELVGDSDDDASGDDDSAGEDFADTADDASDEDDAPGALRIFSFPGVFGGGRLDRGTELLLSCLPDLADETDVLDLGCGSGVIGLLLQVGNPAIRLRLVDESHLAVASTKLTFEENGEGTPDVRVADGCEGTEPESLDLVVSNPPFHAQHALTVEEATRLFRPIREVLRPGGELYVVGAHGVDYGPTLRRFFPEVERIATDRRYAVHRCRR